MPIMNNGSLQKIPILRIAFNMLTVCAVIDQYRERLVR